MRSFQLDGETTRQAFGRIVYEEAKKDERVYAIGADTVKNLGFGPMEKAFPSRVINIGIAEQNMMCMAAGLATDGNRVFVGSYAPFLTMRALEQFRTFIAYPHLNVKIGGGMGGFSAGNEGATHQGPEDVNIMSIMPGTIVTAPADATSAAVITKVICGTNDPAYIRLGKTQFYKVFDEDYSFAIGKGNVLEEGTDLTIISYGTMVSRSLQAHDVLLELGISAKVVEMPCIKPMDEELIVRSAKETGAIVVAEESFKSGGFCGRVAMLLAERCPVPMQSVSIGDVFGEAGNHFAIMDKYGLGIEDIVRAAKEVLTRKEA